VENHDFPLSSTVSHFSLYLKQGQQKNAAFFNRDSYLGSLLHGNSRAVIVAEKEWGTADIESHL
jgi:hypothetical protein